MLRHIYWFLSDRIGLFNSDSKCQYLYKTLSDEEVIVTKYNIWFMLCNRNKYVNLIEDDQMDNFNVIVVDKYSVES